MRAADFYTGIVPEVYTALRSTTFDTARYLDFVEQAGQPALELGCGDDGPFLELVRRGIDVDGVDSSEDMLDRGQTRANAEGLDITTYCQAMQDLTLPRTYSAIYLAGPTFNLLPDDESAALALRSIAAHLQPHGQAMVPLWIPDPTPAAEIGRVREAAAAGGATASYTIESEDYDATSRTRRTRTRYELRTSRQTERVSRDWIIHWHTPDGFAELARAAGLQSTATDLTDEGEFTAYLRRVDAPLVG